MPDSEAPRPEPAVQPYLDMRRAAKPAWPGSFDLGASEDSGSSEAEAVPRGTGMAS